MKKPLLIFFILVLAFFGLIANDRPATDPAASPAGGISQPKIPSLPSPGGAQDAAPGSVQAASPSPQVELPPLPSIPVSLFAGDYADKLQISELMPKNKASLPDAQGRFPDWAELENISDEPVILAGWALTDREGQARWHFSSGELQPGERLLVFI